MKATGIVVEYNPFHNGHKLHALAARKETNADIIIAVMSGNFLQRGEPAFIDKWTRTEMALKNGVDLVFELPYAFATAHAPSFAKGAIQLLDAAQCEAYCFGSEAGQIEPFINSMTLLQTAHEVYEQMIQQNIATGISYPLALNQAYEQLTHDNKAHGPFINLSQPNNILGFHYLQAAHQLNSTMRASTIQRVGANYHDDTFNDESIGSATAIRKNFFETAELHNARNFMPKTAFDLLATYYTESKRFGDWASFYPFLRMIILREGPKQLMNIADVTEGIENLIYRAARQHHTFHDFMKMIKSKRYTWTRIQRMLTHILTGYTDVMRNKISAPSYLRLLGMNQQGRHYLKNKKKHFKLPLISKVSTFTNDSLAVDIQTTNIYALGLNEPHLVNADYKKPPIITR